MSAPAITPTVTRKQWMPVCVPLLPRERVMMLLPSTESPSLQDGPFYLGAERPVHAVTEQAAAVSTGRSLT